LPADRRVDGRTWKIAGVVTLGGIMSSVDTTLVNVALESFAHDFHASITDVQWISTGYLLGLVATIPLAGYSTGRRITRHGGCPTGCARIGTGYG